MAKFRYTRWSIEPGPLNQHVTMRWQGRQLLGEVIGCTFNSTRGAVILQVRHFNGEIWPVMPAASAVDILERN